MKEREFQATVIKMAQALGWRVWHVPTPMRPLGQGRWAPDKRGAGLPDLLLIHASPPRMIFAEIKVDSDLSEQQEEFLRLARGVADSLRGLISTTVPVPLAVYVWRPNVIDLIETTLRGAA